MSWHIRTAHAPLRYYKAFNGSRAIYGSPPAAFLTQGEAVKVAEHLRQLGEGAHRVLSSEEITNERAAKKSKARQP